MKVFYLFCPNCVREPSIPSALPLSNISKWWCKTSRNHNTPGWGPREPDYANLKVLLPDVVTLWWSMNLLASHKSQPEWLNSLWWVERWPSWRHWWAVFTLGYQRLIFYLLSMSDRNKEKLIEKRIIKVPHAISLLSISGQKSWQINKLKFFKNIDNQNVDKDAKNLDLSYIVGADTTLEISLSVPLKTKYTLSIQPNNCILGHLSHKKMKIMSIQKPIYLLIAALFTTVSTWKQSKCPTIGEWWECGRSILWDTTHQQGWTNCCCTNLDGSSGHYAEWKKATLKRSHTLWLHYKTLLKWQNYSGGEETSDCQRLGMGERKLHMNMPSFIYSLVEAEGTFKSLPSKMLHKLFCVPTHSVIKAYTQFF